MFAVDQVTRALSRGILQSIRWAQHVLNVRPSDGESTYRLVALMQIACNLETHFASQALDYRFENTNNSSNNSDGSDK